MTTRDVGDRIDLRYEARDPDGNLTAATMALTVTDPTDDTSTPSITNPGTGLYDASFTLTEAGLWRWVWTASGAVVDVQYGDVLAADPSPSTYATLAQLRKRVTGSDDGSRDDELSRALAAAARDWDEDTGRRPGGFELARTATARTFQVAGRTLYDRDTGRHRLLVDEIGSTAGMVVETGDGTTWTPVTDYRTEPLNALADQKPITGLSRTGGWGCDLVRVTTRWGWPVTHNGVVEAVLIAAHRYHLRKDSPDGTKGGGEFGAVRIARTDPDYMRALHRFELPGIG